MFITKMSLPRRTFLRGMGVTLALPLLEAMVPALTATARRARRTRAPFGAIFVPLGERPGYWTPKTAGDELRVHADPEAARAFRDHVTVVTELVRSARRPRHDGGGVAERHHPEADHRRRRAHRHHDRPGHRQANRPGHRASVARAGDRRLHRLHRRLRHAVYLRLHEHDLVGERRRRRCRWKSTRAWRSSGCSDAPARRAQRSRACRQTGAFSTRCSRRREGPAEAGSDRRTESRLSDYLDNVREIEQRIQKAEKQAKTDVTVPDAPIGVPESFEEHVALLFDLLALAYEANLTRVFTFMMSRDASQRVYPNIGVTEPHHSMSHHGNNPEKIANLVKLNTYHMSLFAKFLEKLPSTPDGDGSLLDHSLILYGSGMSESDKHSRLNIPTPSSAAAPGAEGQPAHPGDEGNAASRT